VNEQAKVSFTKDLMTFGVHIRDGAKLYPKSTLPNSPASDTLKFIFALYPFSHLGP